MPAIRSTRARAALFICALMFLLIAVHSATAYHQLRNAAVAAARERLIAVSAEVGELVEMTLQPLPARMRGVAEQPAVVQFLLDPESSSEAAAREALRSNPEPVLLGAELRDEAGRRVLATSDSLPGVADTLSTDLRSLALNMTGTRIGHLREQGGEIIYPAVRRVVGEGRTLGHLVRWRRLAAGDRTLVQVRELIGRGAVVHLANARGDVWTDLSTSVAPLALRPDTLVGPVRYTGPAGEVLAAAVRVEGTPWSILVAFPYDEILSQPIAFIRWQLGTGLLLLLVATAIALALLGRLTGSLSELADAARAISAGDYGRRTRVEGEDEVGTLGRAFNRMAESVEGAHKQLGAQLDLIAAANERHQRTSERLEHLISSSRAIIYTLQITRTGTELDWISDNIVSVLGYTAEEALTPGWWVSNVHPEDRVGHIPPAERPIEEYFQHEYRFRTKDGEYRWIHDEQRSHRREDRQGFEVVGTLTDVTEQRNLRIAKEAAEAASNAKSQFLSRMSHELRTPMNAILGFSQLLELEVEGEENHESVEQILRAGRHLLNLINEVLDLARIEAGGVTLSLEPVNVAQVEAESLELIGGLAVQEGVRVGSDYTQAFVVADQQRLKQVLLNLLSNAIKYNRPGGSVRIHHEVRPEGVLRISVTDTGRGLTEEARSRLFTPFERFDAEAAGIQGTGLGLSLSKGLVEAMGGEIGAEGGPEGGSTFWVEFPLAEAAEVAAVAEQEADEREDPLRDGQRTLLYIEDNVSNLELLRRLFKPIPDLRLIPAMQGRLGLDLARELRPDVILLDVHLPDLMGHEVLDELKRDPDLRNIPVVVISADATQKQIERLMRSGAREYLTKPFDVNRLREVIGAALEESRGGKT